MKVVELFKNDLIDIIQDSSLNPVVEICKNRNNGHFASTIALSKAKKMNLDSMLLAENIKSKLLEKEMYESVEVIKPGFINVKIKSLFLTSVLTNINEEKENYGQNPVKDYIYNIELVSANPTGWLHVGHARNAVFGDTLVRILKKDGYPTKTEYYTNDAGNQINVLAVTVFVHYLKILGVDAVKPENSYSGDAYDDVAKIFIDEYGDKFKDISFSDKYINDKEIHEIFKQKSIKYFMKIITKQLSDFGVTINHYSSEQAMYDNHEIDKMLELYKKNDAVYEKDSALWLKTTKCGDDKDRVLIKSDGTYTYIVPDLATHHIRFQRSKADKYINVWGGDHHGYIPRMRAGLTLLGDNGDALDIETVQMVRLIKDGQEYKMSKRKGTAVWLIDLLEIIGKDALRYMLNSKAASSHMDLDLDLVQQKNSSNPVYYVQYATARCNSVIRQAKDKDIKPRCTSNNLLTTECEITLLILLDNFSEIIHAAAKNRAPQLLVDYTHRLAAAFHSYYSESQILNDENLELSQFRLGLVVSVLRVLTNAFELLGIQPKEKM